LLLHLIILQLTFAATITNNAVLFYICGLADSEGQGLRSSTFADGLNWLIRVENGQRG